jgi:hypothetical protein
MEMGKQAEKFAFNRFINKKLTLIIMKAYDQL